MPKNREIYEIMQKIAPFNTQMDFDNAGFLVGDEKAECRGILVALDVTDEAIECAVAENCNLIVTHHPVIFEPLKKVTAESLVFKLIQNGISVISAHTNLDMAPGGVNDTLAKRLGLTNVRGVVPLGDVYEARVGEIDVPLTPDEFAAYLKEQLPDAAIKYVGVRTPIKTVGVCSGSGGSLLNEMESLCIDAFVTADVKHNVFLESAQLGISLYDCGHFDTEDVIVEPLKARLSKETGLKVVAFHSELIRSL